MAQKILVTGGAGYVGSALVPSLLKRGYEVVVYDLYLYGDVFNNLKNPRLKEIKGDIRDAERLIHAGRGADQLIHLACISNDPSFDLNPALGKSINYDAFFNVLQTTERNRIKRLIYASSASVYGVREGEMRETVEPRPITDYARYKYECEKLLHHSPINHVIIRPATICGYAPRRRLDVVVNILTINALVNKKIQIFGGSQKRPNLNIKDMVGAYQLVLAAPDSLVSGEIFNIGHSNLPVLEIARMVKKVLADKKIKLEQVDTQDIRSYHLNTKRMIDILKFRPRYSVAEAIMSLKRAHNKNLFTDALNNPLYHNIKMMRQIKLV